MFRFYEPFKVNGFDRMNSPASSLNGSENGGAMQRYAVGQVCSFVGLL